MAYDAIALPKTPPCKRSRLHMEDAPVNAAGVKLPSPCQMDGPHFTGNSSRRLLTISDELPAYELLIQACKDDVLPLPVKSTQWSSDDLGLAIVNKVSRAGDIQPLASVGLMDHGELVEHRLFGSNGFSRFLADCVQPPGELHRCTDLNPLTHWTGTKTNSGRPEEGCNMENGPKSVEELYFHAKKLEAWRRNFRKAADEQSHWKNAEDPLDGGLPTSSQGSPAVPQ